MLKSGDTPAIQKLFARMDGEARGIIRGVVELVWYMRGGIQYHDMLNMTYSEREIVGGFLEERIEKIKKHSFPIY